ncbi:hypothetical protein KMW28_22890 [Flammeovirga yaeyamensis]|uniref:Cytochrome c domain-containing protein n=1 Tax=Flammeovirga yaeyamensis TaxID=367791 RepID=A0AAX1NEW7_9BACT|nr:hypothetical protein [Flammeovirga yaeyamensis]MBB3696789.1 hypothetical protein [Flammeovirga yaeyamensis]NMF33455.1 hypothetical protein [Flammeovirga yaeyamensis]QWG05270.1 hypothetical protein KMW28_22890 [Flammeovirga yaeyamensis]
MNRNKIILSLASLLFIIIAACKSVEMSSVDPVLEIGEVSYNGTIKRIIQNHCVTCHSGKRPTGDLDLTTYENVVDAIKTKDLLNLINNKNFPMPTTGLISKKERKAIQKWAENGFLRSSKKEKKEEEDTTAVTFEAPNLQPIDIDKNGFEFLEKMQGHWVGKIHLLGRDIPWFAFDFRAINSSQIHGLFEGGSMGNLFNTFFVADFKGTKTIMLRNGGILGGIYRTSYFVMTEADNDEYLFVDAYGGKQIMWVKISFKNDQMKMLTYTSKMGMKTPSKHIEFDGRKLHQDLAQNAAKKYQFPSKEVVKSFPQGMPLQDWGPEYPVVTSASYIMANDDYNYALLGEMSGDPIQIKDIKNIASLHLKFSREDLSKGKNIQVYLSRVPLTNEDTSFKSAYGYIEQEAMDEVLLFPEIDYRDQEFTLTYLHEGKCYITFVVDNNQDMVPSKGDYYSVSQELDLVGESNLEVNNITNTIN